MILKGKVKSGLGTAEYWVGKIKDVFEKKTNMNLIVGTLNVELDKPYIVKEDFIIRKEEYFSTQDVLVKKCKVLGNTAYIVRAAKNQKEKGDHPLNILEIVSNINFRKGYNLEDGDQVEIIL